MLMKILNCHRVFFIFVLLLVFNSNLEAAQTTVVDQHDDSSVENEKIDQLIELGAPELALSFIDQLQPDVTESSIQVWLSLEQQRFHLLMSLEQWSGVVQRSQLHKQLLSNILINDSDKNWFKSQRIKALLQQENYTAALKEIQHALWLSQTHADSDEISLWRRLLIRSYLNLDWVDDAQRALRRYQQDYGDFTGSDISEWTLLQAQLLMRTDRPLEAVRLLEKIEQVEAHGLLLLAKKQANALSAKDVNQQVNKRLANKKFDNKQKSIYWYVRLNVAVQESDQSQIIKTLEQLYYLKKTSYLTTVFSEAQKILSIDFLWEAYQQHGLILANQFKLLRGDDQAWYVKASNLFEKDDLAAKALLSVLVFNAQQQQHRHLAMQQMTALLDKHENGLHLINQLFMRSNKLTDVEQIPVEVRYRLVDFALSRADLNSAAVLMETLRQPPEGQDIFAWSLRRARVLILGGQYVDGQKVLLGLLEGVQDIDTKKIDQYMQVVFDLQSVQQHQFALDAFHQLERLPLTAKLQREIAFWKAESYQQMKNFEQAAFLFLKSAIPLEDKIDPWFHTASFRAAESLAQAGLADDARRQYLKLLRFTANPARKAVIEQRLQQLRLDQSKKLSTANVES